MSLLSTGKGALERYHARAPHSPSRRRPRARKLCSILCSSSHSCQALRPLSVLEPLWGDSEAPLLEHANRPGLIYMIRMASYELSFE